MLGRIMKRKRAILLVMLSFGIAGWAGYLWLTHGSHRSEVFTTHRPGEPVYTWHTMRTKWRVVNDPGWPMPANQIILNSKSVFGVFGSKVYNIDRSTGRTNWKRDLTQSSATNYDFSLSWNITVAGNELFAVEIPSPYQQIPQHLPHMSCRNITSGDPIWETSFSYQLSSAPAYTDNVVLVPLATGEVIGLDKKSGAPLWRRQVSTTHFSPSKQVNIPVLTLKTAGNLCIARAGGRHFMGIDPATGQELWSNTLFGKVRSAEHLLSDDGNTNASDFAAAEDGVFVQASPEKTVALDPKTGRIKWRSRWKPPDNNEVVFSNEAFQIGLMGNIVVQASSDRLHAVYRRDGKPAWVSKIADSVHSGYPPQAIGADSESKTRAVLAVVSDPLIGRTQKFLRSLPNVYDCVQLDLASGKEQWRCQLDDAGNVVSIAASGDSLFIITEWGLMALEPGPAETLPRSPNGRRQLAYAMIEKISGWSPTSDSLLGKIRQRFPMLTGSRAGMVPDSEQKAKFTLMALGKDSVEPLLDLVRHDIVPVSNTNGVVMMGGDPEAQLKEALDILADLRAHAAVSELCKLLDANQTDGVHQAIAAALIRINDKTAMPTLLRYAQSCTDAQARGGEEAMYYLCRFAPEGDSDGGHHLVQADLTSCLLSEVADPKAPTWQRRMASFELLRSRGPAAAAAAGKLYTEGKPCHVMPDTTQDLELNDRYANVQFGGGGGGASSIAPTAITKDSSGTYWATFDSMYLGTAAVWIAHSIDKKHWIHPSIAFNSSSTGDQPKLTVTGSAANNSANFRLVSFDETKHPLVRSISQEALYRDSDHDGLPDIVEKAIGTSPRLADSWHTGVKDGDNKNPLYRPHVLSNEEQIYQAVIEGICHYSLMAPPASPLSSSRVDPPFNPACDLVIPSGPSSKGIPIRCWPKAVLAYPQDTPNTQRQVLFQFGFMKPMFDFDGKLRHPNNADGYSEPWYQLATYNGSQFKEVFQSIKSKDGKRVRVSVSNANNQQVYEVEVDKIGERWLPVECRLVRISQRQDNWNAAAPMGE